MDKNPDRLIGIKNLGGGFKHFLFSPLLGETIQFDEHIFQMGWVNHQLGMVLSQEDPSRPNFADW